MPKYQVPPEPNYTMDMPSSGNRRKKKRQPTVSVPMNPEWLAKVKTGEKAEITLVGEIVGVSMHDDEYGKESRVRLAVDSVSYYGNEEKEVADVMNDEED